VCGAETIEQAIRRPPPVGAGLRVAVAELDAVVSELGARQPLNGLTGSVHAAAWVVPGAGIRLVREDVGRHNALDKVIGALLREGTDPGGGRRIGRVDTWWCPAARATRWCRRQQRRAWPCWPRSRRRPHWPSVSRRI